MVTDSITYAAKYKIDTNLLLIDGSVSEFKAGNLLSWGSASSPTSICYIKSQLTSKPTKFSVTFFQRSVTTIIFTNVMPKTKLESSSNDNDSFVDIPFKKMHVFFDPSGNFEPPLDWALTSKLQMCSTPSNLFICCLKIMKNIRPYNSKPNNHVYFIYIICVVYRKFNWPKNLKHRLISRNSKILWISKYWNSLYAR